MSSCPSHQVSCILGTSWARRNRLFSMLKSLRLKSSRWFSAIPMHKGLHTPSAVTWELFTALRRDGWAYRQYKLEERVINAEENLMFWSGLLGKTVLHQVYICPTWVFLDCISRIRQWQQVQELRNKLPLCLHVRRCAQKGFYCHAAPAGPMHRSIRRDELLNQSRLFSPVHVFMNLRTWALLKEQSDWDWSAVGESAACCPLAHRILCDVRLAPCNMPVWVLSSLLF